MTNYSGCFRECVYFFLQALLRSVFYSDTASAKADKYIQTPSPWNLQFHKIYHCFYHFKLGTREIKLGRETTFLS